MPTKKKKPFLLNVVLQSLVGHPVCLEIKNDDEVHGTIESVDRDMNVSLVDVTYVFAKVRPASKCVAFCVSLLPPVVHFIFQTSSDSLCFCFVCVHVIGIASQVKHRERSSNALVMGSKIRYVHLPDSVNVVAVSPSANAVNRFAL